MASAIIPRIIRGRLFYQTADVLFPTFTQAATAWAAAEAHRLDVAEPIDKLIVERMNVLAEMRRSAGNLVAFSAASKREAELAVRIRRLRRAGAAA
jgi:hypothetical protein